MSSENDKKSGGTVATEGVELSLREDTAKDEVPPSSSSAATAVAHEGLNTDKMTEIDHEAVGGVLPDSDDDGGDSDGTEEDHERIRRASHNFADHAKTIGHDIYRADFWKLSYDIANMYFFWILVSLLIISEPILVSWNPYDYPNVIYIASGILTASTVCLGIQLAGRAYDLFLDDENFRREKVKLARAENNKEMKLTTNEVQLKDKMSIFIKKVVFSGAFVLEAACLTLGWVTLYTWPGIATLRCFRAFRLLWFHELPHDVLGPLKHGLGRLFCLFGGIDFVELVFKVMKYATVTLSHLGQEMLCLTKKSRGGFILMFMLFYIAYVLGTTLWIETVKTDLGNDFCVDVLSCTYTMLRLTFFDGNGFDFAYSLVETKKHTILFMCCVLYLCITSFGIVNGLIGVFGDIFKDDSDRVFETQKELLKEAQDKENEHFQRYNNTAESLILVQVQLKKMDERMDKLEKLLETIANK